MRSQISEQRYIYGLLASSEIVTISVVDVAGDAVLLDDDSCTELLVRGDGKSVYQWDTQNIEELPSSFTEIVWLMTDGTNYAQGSMILGGYPDSVDTTVSSRSTLTAAQVNEQADIAIADAGLATAAAQDYIRKLIKNTKKFDDTAKTLTIYDDDNVTPLVVYDAKDGSGVATHVNIKWFVKQ